VSGATAQAPTLLLVDDEERILSSLRRSLRREGWRILATTDPIEAMAWLETESIDVVVSDHKMPNVAGTELLAAAARLRPRAARFLLTGWPEAVPPGVAAALGLCAVVPKPWDETALRALLRRTLGAGR
jgi:DNA-binding NtrC family response regulator